MEYSVQTICPAGVHAGKRSPTYPAQYAEINVFTKLTIDREPAVADPHGLPAQQGTTGVPMKPHARQEVPLVDELSNLAPLVA